LKDLFVFCNSSSDLNYLRKLRNTGKSQRKQQEQEQILEGSAKDPKDHEGRQGSHGQEHQQFSVGTTRTPANLKRDKRNTGKAGKKGEEHWQIWKETTRTGANLERNKDHWYNKFGKPYCSKPPRDLVRSRGETRGTPANLDRNKRNTSKSGKKQQEQEQILKETRTIGTISSAMPTAQTAKGPGEEPRRNERNAGES
jgi:hypothetical protein